MNNMNFIENHVGRFAIGKKMSNLNKTIIVQLVYLFREVNVRKNRKMMINYGIKIKSINGFIEYGVKEIKNNGKFVIFLYGSDLYCLDLNESLFDNKS